MIPSNGRPDRFAPVGGSRAEETGTGPLGRMTGGPAPDVLGSGATFVIPNERPGERSTLELPWERSCSPPPECLLPPKEGGPKALAGLQGVIFLEGRTWNPETSADRPSVGNSYRPCVPNCGSGSNGQEARLAALRAFLFVQMHLGLKVCSDFGFANIRIQFAVGRWKLRGVFRKERSAARPGSLSTMPGWWNQGRSQGHPGTRFSPFISGSGIPTSRLIVRHARKRPEIPRLGSADSNSSIGNLAGPRALYAEGDARPSQPSKLEGLGFYGPGTGRRRACQ